MDTRNLRTAARITQWELAEITSISRMRLRLAECGYVSLAPAELDAIRCATVSTPEARLLGLRQTKAETEQGGVR